MSEIDVLLVTALKEEHDAARDVALAGARNGSGVATWEERDSATPAPYLIGMYADTTGNNFSVALARPTRMGATATAPIVASLVERLKPRCLAMCGDCAGNPGDVALGDVVIAEMVYTYDEGKSKQDAFEGDHRQIPMSDAWVRSAQDMLADDLPSFGPASSEESRNWALERLYAGDDPRTNPARTRYFPRGTWSERIHALETEGLVWRDGSKLVLTEQGHSFIEDILFYDPDGPQRLPFQIKVGPIASGNVVVKNGITWDNLKKWGVRSVLGLEMEAAVIGSAAHRLGVPAWVVAKGVMDHADPRKDDRYKPFAARASAEVIFKFLLGQFGSARGRGKSQEVDSQTRGAVPTAGRIVEDAAFFRADVTEKLHPIVYPSDAQNEIARNVRAVVGEIIAEKASWSSDAQLLMAGESNYINHILNVVGTFALFATSRSVPVDSSYVNVSVSREIERERYRSVSEIEAALRTQSVGQCGKESGVDPMRAIELSARGFTLIGSPGSGKTTIFRWVAIQVARGIPIQGKRRLAIYLAVRDLASPDKSKDPERRPVLHGIMRYMDLLGIKRTDAVLTMLLQTGRCVILIDGLDETEPEEQDTILQEIATMHTRWPGCLICVSARPHSLCKAMPGFVKWETVSLSFEDRIMFVRKWFSHVNATKGERLIERCKSSPGLLDLGSSPLLLSIVCALFDHDLDIPSDPGELYARAVEGMLGGWDAFRNIARTTPLANFSLRKRLALVSSLAFDMFERSKIVFACRDVDESGCLKRVARTARTPVPASEDVLVSLYNDFGILVERSPGLYSFSHLTIQEYLVGRYIVDARQEIVLAARAGNPEWHEVIRVVARLLPQADAFMRALHQAVKLTSFSSAVLLGSVWRSVPLCSEGERKNLISQLAKAIGSTVGSIALSLDIDGDTLRIKPKDLRSLKLANAAMVRRNRRNEPRERSDEEAKEEDKGNHKVRSNKTGDRSPSDFSPLALLECLPELLEIVVDSGFSYVELGVDSNVMYRFLSGHTGVKIADVAVVGLDVPREDGDLPKRKRHDWRVR